ncbi:MAG: phosphoribosylanthranilate isomerase [Ignavibacteriaceae bacterium]
MKVKICGITNTADAILAEQSGADAIGFIFYKGSKRYISPEDAKNIIRQLSPFTMKVGVFVNEDTDTVNMIASNIKLNAVQLHGAESPEYIEKIAYPVIKSFRVEDDFNYSRISNYNGVSILLDTFSAAEYGGTGFPFNWNLIPVELRSMIILAGGISILNIDEVITTVKPAAVDISSSLEKEPGKKDERKIKQFFQIINSYRSNINGNHDET